MKCYSIIFSWLKNCFWLGLFIYYFFSFYTIFFSLFLFFCSFFVLSPLFFIALIEEEVFSAAAASASTEDDSIEILQVYSREISRWMLDTVKIRAASSASSAMDASAPHTPSPSLEPTASEDEWWSLDFGLSVDFSGGWFWIDFEAKFDLS